MTTYHILPGQQYDAAGARIEWNTLCASYGHDGRFLCGDFPFRHADQLDPIVRRVLETREAETLALADGSESTGTWDEAAWTRHTALMADMDRPDSDN